MHVKGLFLDQSFACSFWRDGTHGTCMHMHVFLVGFADLFPKLLILYLGCLLLLSLCFSRCFFSLFLLLFLLSICFSFFSLCLLCRCLCFPRPSLLLCFPIFPLCFCLQTSRFSIANLVPGNPPWFSQGMESRTMMNS